MSDILLEEYHKYKFDCVRQWYDESLRDWKIEKFTKSASGKNAYEAAKSIKDLPKDTEIIRVYKDGSLLKSFTSRSVGEQNRSVSLEKLKGID